VPYALSAESIRRGLLALAAALEISIFSFLGLLAESELDMLSDRSWEASETTASSCNECKSTDGIYCRPIAAFISRELPDSTLILFLSSMVGIIEFLRL